MAKKKTKKRIEITWTPMRLVICRFIDKFTREKGYSPTYEEIAAEFGISKVTVFEHIRNLEKMNVLTTSPHKARATRIVSGTRLYPSGQCPTCGSKIETQPPTKGTHEHDRD